MGEELSALLKLHAQNGGSAIVLSATLSLEQRRNMTKAFAKGLGLREPEDLSNQLCSEAYPLLTSDGPQVLVVSPDPDQVEDANWLEPVLGKAAFVYRHAGVMWRSAKALFDAGRIDTPESFRPLIKCVYAKEDVPPALEEKQIEAEGKEMGSRSLGQFNVVDLQDGYGNLSTELSGTEDIGTRLGEPTVTLRLASIEEGRLVPWCVAPDDDPNRAWALSEIRVRENFLQGASPPSEDQALHERAKRDWPAWEREILIAVVEGDGQVRLEGADNDFTYSKKRGMV